MSSSEAAQRRQRAKEITLLSQEGLERVGLTLWYAIKDFFTDDGPQWAAAIAYYSLLSSFPLVLAIVSIATFVLNEQNTQQLVQEITNIAGDFIPQGASQVESIIQEAVDARQTASILSILGLLWTGTRVLGALTKALNIAYDVEERYSFWKRWIIELAMLLTAGALFIVAIAVDPLLRLLSGTLSFLPGAETVAYQLISDLLPAILLTVALFLIYRFLPRRDVDWQPALLGALIAALAIMIAQPLFVYYVSQFGNYNLIYGSLAVVIILIFWAWIVAAIVLIGGEVVSHAQAILVEGHAPKEVGERHKERAPTRKKEPQQVGDS